MKTKKNPAIHPVVPALLALAMVVLIFIGNLDQGLVRTLFFANAFTNPFALMVEINFIFAQIVSLAVFVTLLIVKIDPRLKWPVFVVRYWTAFTVLGVIVYQIRTA